MMTQRRNKNAPPQGATWRTRLGIVLGGLAVLGVCVAIRYFWGGESASADQPRQATAQRAPRRAAAAHPAATQAASTSSSASSPGLVALVNGQRITRDELATECLRHYGEQVLESLVNKYLIAYECKRRNIVVSKEDVDAEIRRMAERFSLPVDQWLKMLKEERGITATQYANDIIWPTLALRRLAGSQLQVTREELIEAYEMRYGPAVRVRLISCKDPEKAKELRARAAATPDQFGELAKQYSEDVPSAAAKGLIPPIRKHSAHEKIEQAAFAMSDGQVSQVIQAGGQYVILKREREIPGVQAANYEALAPQLEELIRDGKVRSVAHDVFRKLQQDAKVVNVLNDARKRREMPNTAALINGRPIPLDQLAEHCAQRHGEEVLDGMIHRALIEQACRQRGVTVSDQEMDQEIVRAAAEAIDLKQDGSPDVEKWLELVTQQQGVTEEVYRRDAVWPSVALRKLVAGTIQITQEDLEKAFEASYGARVRCRAIVLDNLRRANAVWDMARKDPTAENFGDLAEQYSIEPQSQALRGEVPPIQQHGGQPLLEREAFALRPGELSGVIQVDDHYLILFCEGHTKPADVTFEEVREEVRRSIFEKKQRLAMADYFERLKDAASIDNYLAGTTRRPKRQAEPDQPRPIKPDQRVATPEAREAPRRR
jgi:parvulin-like peptidyl-prolyl isomerase